MRSFHRMPYEWKKENPQEHSCAVCYLRPIDFCIAPDTHRTSSLYPWRWFAGVTEEQKRQAFLRDCYGDTSKNLDELREYFFCPVVRWTKAQPFYKNDCSEFEKCLDNITFNDFPVNMD